MDYLSPTADSKLLANDLQGLVDNEICVDTEFIGSPSKSEFIVSVERLVRDWLIGSGTTQEKANALSRNLRQAFAEELQLEWSKSHERYGSLERFLNAPMAADRTRETVWENYKSWLRSLPNKPIVPGLVSLRDVYFDLRAYWDDISDEDGHRVPIRRVVEVDRELDEWIGCENPRQAIRLLSGGPGSGKSSVVRMFASRLSERDDFHTVFVPIYLLEFGGDFGFNLEDSLERFAKADSLLPTSFLESRRRLILLLDGLDELALAGPASDEAARTLVRELVRLTHRRNRDGRIRLQVLLSGRQVAVSAYASELREARDLHLLGLNPEHEPRETKIRTEPRSLLTDIRDAWWRTVSSALEGAEIGFPDDLRGAEFSELTDLPFLNTALVLLWQDRSRRPEERRPRTLSELFGMLISLIYRRDWGELHPSSRILTEDEYFNVLKELAVAAWLSGNQMIISERVAEDHLVQAGYQGLLGRFLGSPRKGLASLLTIFHFRRVGPEGEGEASFEFTNKSFAEFLVCCAIGDLLSQIGRLPESGSMTSSAELEELSRAWSRLLGPRQLSEAMMRFLDGEITKRAGCHGALSRVMAHCLTKGLPYRPGHTLNLKEIRNVADNAEAAMLLCLASSAEAEERVSQFCGSSEEIPRLLSQLNSWDGRQLILDRCLRRANLRRQRVGVADLAGARFDYSDLTGADLTGATLRRAKFSNATLVQTRLARTDLRDADLAEVNLSNANLEGADLTRADLRGVDLRGAVLKRAILRETRLEGANLGGANLEGATFLFGSLAGADLTGARLNETRLVGTIIGGAIFENIRFDSRTEFQEPRGNPERADTNLLRAVVTGGRETDVDYWDDNFS